MAASPSSPAPVAPARLRTRIPEIRALTGIRIVAALLVVFFHVRGNLLNAYPTVADALWPVLDSGFLGVDLFFALSGLVLTLNYVDAIGLRLTRTGTSRFLWARVARVWPAYAVTLLIAAAWHVGMAVSSWQDPVPVRDLTALSFLRQLFLVVLWNEPSYDRLTWNGPAWSVSAETLAYTAFPVLALLLFRLDRTMRARHLVPLALVATLPLLVLGVLDHNAAFMWLLRLVANFTAGALAALVVRKVWTHVTDRPVMWPVWLTAFSTVAIVGGLFLAYESGRPDAAVAVVVFFPLLLIGLSLSTRGLAAVLGTRVMVFGGRISYSVYLVHMVLVIEPFWALQTRYPADYPDQSTVAQTYFLLAPVLALVLGWALWRFVEEPAQRRMRAMIISPAPGRSAELPTLQPHETGPARPTPAADRG